MTRHRDRPERRRNFLRSLVRYPVLGALGLLGGRLVKRQAGTGPVQAGRKCTNRGICRGCLRLSTCCLPQALMARNVLDRDGPIRPTF